MWKSDWTGCTAPISRGLCAAGGLAAGPGDRGGAFVHALPRTKPAFPWHVGVLYSHLDERFSKFLIARLQAETDLCIGDNEPYSGHLPGDAIDRHACVRGGTTLLIRNDLIATPAEQVHWAGRLAVILTDVLEGL